MTKPPPSIAAPTLAARTTAPSRAAPNQGPSIAIYMLSKGPQRLGYGDGGTSEDPLPAARSDVPHARWERFDLHAGVVVPGHRARLERLCRYVLRPPVTGERLPVAADGRVVLRLRHSWADGTTHVAFEPTAFLERLAVLVPRPRINLLLYHGVLAAHAAWRAEVVARAPSGGAAPATGAESDAAAATSPGTAGRRWADLMRRAFEVDVLACPRCGGRRRPVSALKAYSEPSSDPPSTRFAATPGLSHAERRAP